MIQHLQKGQKHAVFSSKRPQNAWKKCLFRCFSYVLCTFMWFWKSISSSHLEVLCGQTACHIAENGSNKCRFSLWIGTIVRPFCNHNETEMLVNTTTLVHLLLLSRKFWFLVPREGLFSEKNVLRGQIRGKWAFLERIGNQRLPFSWQTTNLSELCNDLVKAMEWACQMWHMRPSDATSKRVICHIWAPQMPHVTISDVENEENGAEKRFSHSRFSSRLNGKGDKNL